MNPGAKLGRYRVDALLGRGGMGEVYRGFDEDLGRAVALKVMLAPDPMARARFQREARTASQFTHPNAATVFDVGEAEGVPFIVMELIDGDTLLAASESELDARGAPSLNERARWLIDAGRALEAAHAAHLIHRDVKPQNVMITRSGTVKLLDFGIARRIEGARDDASAPTDAALGTLTEEGGLVGSVAYMSPEQVNSQPLDGRADQFAWAVMAHQVLAGKPVWAGTSSVFSIAAAILHEEPTVDTTVPSAIGQVLKKCLAKNREQRYPTMTEALAAFDAALNAPSAHADTQISATNEIANARTEASENSEKATLSPPSASSESNSRSLEGPRGPRGKWPMYAVPALGAVALAVGYVVTHSTPPTPPAVMYSTPPPSASAAAPPSASSAASSASAAPTSSAIAEPLTVKCKPEVKLECQSADDQRWCIDPDKPIVCCAKGLVGTPAGRCACPDGGTKVKAAIDQGCKEVNPKYTDSLRTVIRAHFGEFKDCYEKALTKNPKLGGKLTLAFGVTNHGRMASPHLGSTSMPDVDFQDCALGVLENVQFEPPPEGYLTVGYPLEFSPGP